MATALYIKLLNDLQGATLLLERGVISPARSLIRVGLETLLILANISQDDEFHISYINSDQIKRLKLLRVIRDSRAVTFDDIRPKVKDEIINGLIQEINEKGITEDKIEYLANRCGLKSYYDSIYRLFSQDVPSAPRVIEAYCNFNDEQELVGFSHGYEKSNIIAELTVIPRIMYLGMFAMNKLFNLDIDVELKEIDEKLRSLEMPPSI